jgi:hypothetical protein
MLPHTVEEEDVAVAQVVASDAKDVDGKGERDSAVAKQLER